MIYKQIVVHCSLCFFQSLNIIKKFPILQALNTETVDIHENITFMF